MFLHYSVLWRSSNALSLPVLPHGLDLRLVEDEDADEDEEASENEGRHDALHRLVRPVELILLPRPPHLRLRRQPRRRRRQRRCHRRRDEGGRRRGRWVGTVVWRVVIKELHLYFYRPLWRRPV